MYKYIITWIVSSYIVVPCPDKQPNEFGIVSSPNITCSVNHVQITKQGRDKQFTHKDQALVFKAKIDSFVVNQNNSFSSLGQAQISEVKLDSIKN